MELENIQAMENDMREQYIPTLIANCEFLSTRNGHQELKEKYEYLMFYKKISLVFFFCALFHREALDSGNRNQHCLCQTHFTCTLW